MDYDFSIIVTVKNRRDHFLKTFPSLVTQNQKQKYEIIYVDFASNDGFYDSLLKTVDNYRPLFSESLKEVKRVSLSFDVPFNSGKSKNLGSLAAKGRWLSFSDVDVFLGMNYHRNWLSKLEETHKTFFTTRIQETTAQPSRRIRPWINYGNMIVDKNDFKSVGGFDENNPTWGGDDDDIAHRLKLTGLREINPANQYDAHHTTILHGDEDRLEFLESKERSERHSIEKFKKIYENSDPLCKSYLEFYNKNRDRINVESIYKSS